MPKFAQATKGMNRTVTHEGALAYKTPNKKEDLVRQILTTFFNEPKFYGNVHEQTADLLKLIRGMADADPKFVSNLAIFARQEFNLRSVSHVLMAELAASVPGKRYVRETLRNAIVRADDMTEVLAYYLATYGKPIPNSLKKGLADVFPKFDEYQLQKYNRKTDVRLKDVLCIAHPKPKDENYSDLWGRLLEDNLTTPYTWETELSAKGNTKEVWESLIESGLVGYMALLRNLRNILNVEPSNIGKVFDFLSDRKRVLKSRQLPFRFYSAYKEIEGNNSFYAGQALSVLETAIEHSVDNMERLNGKTFIAADDSGSMVWSQISSRSKVRPADIAALLMSIAHSICEQSVTSCFSNDFRIMNLNPKAGILGNTQRVIQSIQGGSTYTHTVFEHLLSNKIKTDRIIIISDDQAHPSFDRNGYYGSKNCLELFNSYREKVNPNVWLHLIDTAGYGRQQFLGSNINYVGGWSEKVFTFIPYVERGMGTLVETIENYR